MFRGQANNHTGWQYKFDLRKQALSHSPMSNWTGKNPLPISLLHAGTRKVQNDLPEHVEL